MDQVTDFHLWETLGELNLTKYVIAVMVIFVLPSVMILINTVLKNKPIASITKILEELKIQNSDICFKVDHLYKGIFDEVTDGQAQLIFEWMALNLPTSIVKQVQRVIAFEKIKNKDLIKAKVGTVISNTLNASIQKLDIFKYKGATLADYTSNEWSEYIKDAVIEFIYSENGESAENHKYNYDILYIKIKEIISTINFDFHMNLRKGLI